MVNWIQKKTSCARRRYKMEKKENDKKIFLYWFKLSSIGNLEWIVLKCLLICMNNLWNDDVNIWVNVDNKRPLKG